MWSRPGLFHSSRPEDAFKVKLMVIPDMILGENFPMDWNIFDLSQEEISGGDSISFNLEGLDVEREDTWNFEDLPFPRTRYIF